MILSFRLSKKKRTANRYLFINYLVMCTYLTMEWCYLNFKKFNTAFRYHVKMRCIIWTTKCDKWLIHDNVWNGMETKASKKSYNK